MWQKTSKNEHNSSKKEQIRYNFQGMRHLRFAQLYKLWPLSLFSFSEKGCVFLDV